LEWATGMNPFIALGNVRTVFREGRYRCWASFPHSVMLGLFWATLVPLFIGLAMTGKNKLLYWSATAASIFIIMATASSTPLGVLLVVLFLLCGFRWRHRTRLAGLCLLGLLTALHIISNKPVWHLISRVNMLKGSTGWHRYYLIDRAIKYFDEWALMGCRATHHWGWGLQDITNQYILEGVFGGLLTLVLFLAMLYLALKVILNSCLGAKKHERQWLNWGLFVAIIGHCIAFFGVSYFGQINMLWYMMLAIVGFLAENRGELALQVFPAQVLQVGKS